jgi:hypothetical protein
MRRFAHLVLVMLALSACDHTIAVTELDCKSPPGGSAKVALLDETKHCVFGYVISSELQLAVNDATNAILLTFLTSDGQRVTDSTYLRNCMVVNARNWRCTEATEPQPPFSPVRHETGMLNGVYYSSTTDDYSPDFYHSSLSGIGRILYKVGWVTADTAITINMKLGI